MQGYLVHILCFSDSEHEHLEYHSQYGFTDKAEAIKSSQLTWDRYEAQGNQEVEIQINAHEIPDDTSPDTLVDALVEAEMDEGAPNCIWSMPQ